MKPRTFDSIQTFFLRTKFAFSRPQCFLYTLRNLIFISSSSMEVVETGLEVLIGVKGKDLAASNFLRSFVFVVKNGSDVTTFPGFVVSVKMAPFLAKT